MTKEEQKEQLRKSYNKLVIELYALCGGANTSTGFIANWKKKPVSEYGDTIQQSELLVGHFSNDLEKAEKFKKKAIVVRQMKALLIDNQKVLNPEATCFEELVSE